MNGRLALGARLSRLGERLDWDWLTYNPIHFLHFHDYAVADAPAVWDAMQATFPTAMRYVDVGAGSCAYAAEGLRRGLHVEALERDRFGRLLGRRHGVHATRFDLHTDMARRRFDVSYSFEVAEHLPPTLGDQLVRYLCDSAPLVLLTAATPGQGGTGHINEQPHVYWQERFESCGFPLHSELTEAIRSALSAGVSQSEWLVRNAMVFALP